MSVIKNDADLVKNITMPGTNEAEGLELAAVAIPGARFVNSERDCNRTYSQGRSTVEIIKSHLLRTFTCMDNTSTILQETDAQVAKNSSLESTWAQKILGSKGE